MVTGARVRVDDVVVAVDGGGALSRRDWEAGAATVGRALAGRGVRAGARVGLLFDGRHWPAFAVAHEAVCAAGAVPVLLSPAAPAAAPAATGLLCSPGLAPVGCRVWVETVDVECGPSRADLPKGGVLVHALAPGSAGSPRVLALVRAGTPAVAQWPFDPDRFCALVAEREAAACGLTPALAAAVLASGAAPRHDLSSLDTVLLSAAPSGGLRAALEAALPGVDIEVPGPPRPAGDPAPAAVSQEAMVWHEQFVPGSFNLPCLVRRHQGPLDVDALARAFTELVRRHEPLRSTFTLDGGRLGQVIGPPGPVPLPVVDLSGLDGDASPAFWLQLPADRRATAAKAEVDLLLADASRRPFDLAAGPLFEPRLVRLGHDDHLLVVRLHHTVFDDWSVDLFRRELSALYAAAVAGSPPPLAEPATTFTEASRRQRERLAAGREADERAWWRRELAGAPLAVQLPLGTGAGEPVRVELGASLSADLRLAARRLRATPFMTALAAFSVLVGRMTGLDDLLLATVVAHRNDSDLEPLIGCFTKKVPLRIRVEGDPTFAELVARARAALVGALAHQDLAFDAAVYEGVGQVAAQHGIVPQVSVVFQGEAPQRERLALPGLVTSRYETGGASREERHFSTTDREGPVWGDGIYLGSFVLVSFVDAPDGMALVVRGVFDRPAGRRLLEAFRSLLVAVVAAPSEPLSTFAVDVAHPVGGDDVIDVRGFRSRRSRLEAALGRAPGVAEVAVVVEDGELVARVAAAGEPPPTLAQLRQALWGALPGAPWPARAVLVDGTPLGPGPPATLLPAMWAELAGRPVAAGDSYWQDFSFLPVLAEAREAGLAITDQQVVRCRTPEMLATAMAVAPLPRD